jgi:Transposase DDE domain
MGTSTDGLWFENWADVEAILGGAQAIDDLAFATGAMFRRRGVRDGSQLLRLALSYAASGQSLRTTAAWSGDALGVALSDPSLIGRLSNAGDFLAALVNQLLFSAAPTGDPPAIWDGPPIRLIDGSMFARPGSRGEGHRLHAAYDPVHGSFSFLDVTQQSEGENLTRCDIVAGMITVGDRNYARTWPLREVAERSAFFCVRAGVSSVRMLDPQTKQKLDAKAILAALGERDSVELPIALAESKGVKKPALPARLIVIRASDEGKTRELARIKRSITKKQVTPRSDTYALAGVMMILTNLPKEDWPIDRVHRLYRLRWQIELAFKTLKSIFKMRKVPNKTPPMARTWILANLAATLLADRLATALQGGVPPSDSRKLQHGA